MNLNYLYYFKVLAETEHYTHAATLLKITQPSLSHAIHCLEEELNAYLFGKQGRNIKLTKYGKIFYNYINEGLLQIEKGQSVLQSITSPKNGQIDLGFIYTLGARFVPQLLKSFLSIEENKNVHFSLNQGTTSQLIQGLKEEKYDIVLCSHVHNEKEIHFLPVVKENLVVIVPNNHPYANRKEIDLSLLKEEKFVYYSKSSGIRPLLDSLFEKVNIEPHIACEVEEDSAVMGLVGINYGIAIVPDIPLIDTFPIHKLKIINPSYERYIYLATMKNRYLPPAVHTFCNFLIQNVTVNNIE